VWLWIVVVVFGKVVVVGRSIGCYIVDVTIIVRFETVIVHLSSSTVVPSQTPESSRLVKC